MKRIKYILLAGCLLVEVYLLKEYVWRSCKSIQEILVHFNDLQVLKNLVVAIVESRQVPKDLFHEV